MRPQQFVALVAMLTGALTSQAAPSTQWQQTLLQQRASSFSSSSFSSHPYPDGHPVLRFAPSSFKVMVISDTHLLDDQTVPGNASNVARASVQAVRTVLQHERPDFVVHLGDLVSGEAANKSSDVRMAVEQILTPMRETRTPFATCKGNHDNDRHSTHARITAWEHAFAGKLSYTRVAPPGVGGGEVGSDNYWVPVFGSSPSHGAGDAQVQHQRPALLLWFFDSRSGKQEADGAQIDDWVDASVAKWIADETAKMETLWGTVPPGLLFVHIPIHEHFLTQNTASYAQHVGGVADERPDNFTTANLTYPGLNDDKPVASQGQESDDDTYAGQDRAFLSAFMQSPAGRARIHGIVSGHDHGADWCAPSQLVSGAGQHVPVCFAKHSGYGGYDYDNWNHGARIFRFDEANVDTGAETYIRFETGETRYQTQLDDAWLARVPA